MTADFERAAFSGNTIRSKLVVTALHRREKRTAFLGRNLRTDVMFSGRFILRLSGTVVIATLCTSCVNDNSQTANTGGGGTFADHLMPSLYGVDPAFQKYASPWIKDSWAFSTFVVKYKNYDHFTEQDRAEILVRLGVPQYAAQWLTPAARRIIETYYPEALKKKAEIGLRVRFAFNDKAPILADYNIADFAIPISALSVLSAPAGGFSIEAYTSAIAAIGEAIPALALGAGFGAGAAITDALLTPAAVDSLTKTVNTIENDIKSGRLNIDNPQISAGGGGITSAECDEEWEAARKICNQELSRPVRNRNFTGGHSDVYNCARGYVSQACGGNRVN